jgi:hypothetical protein
LSLTLLFADYTLTATPTLNTIVAGAPAAYTVIVTPSNGFNQQVQLSCGNLPGGAKCAFASTAVTPNGSSVSVALTINTTKNAALMRRWKPFGGTPPAGWLLGVACLGALWSLIHLRMRLGVRQGRILALAAVWPKLAILSLVLALALLAGSCRGVVGLGGGTPTGNYTISINGTLTSNTTVVRSATVNLAVT